MHPSDLIRLLRDQPFVPLRLSLTDGTTYVIRHPDLALVDRYTLHLGVPGRRGPDRPHQPLDHVVHIALLHIVRAEPVNGTGKRPAKKAKMGDS